MQNIQAILFDLDGTLLDSAPDLAAAANAMRFERQMEPLPLEALRPFVGTGARGMLRIALGVEEHHAQFSDLREEFFCAYESCMGAHSKLFCGAALVLERLSAVQMPWGIVTNKIERFARPIVEKNAVLRPTQTLVCGDTTGHIKPHPAPLLLAARELGIEPQRCIYVGDDERDIQAARAAEMKSAAANYGYLGEARSAAQWSPDMLIERLEDLLGLPSLLDRAGLK